LGRQPNLENRLNMNTDDLTAKISNGAAIEPITTEAVNGKRDTDPSTAEMFDAMSAGGPSANGSPPPYVPAIIGARLTAEGTVGPRGMPLLDLWHLGLTLDRKQLVLRSPDGYLTFELPPRLASVTEKFIREAFEQAGVPEKGDESIIAKCATGIRQTLKSDKAFRKASTVKPRRVSFLWNPYLPIGKATMLAGDGGSGKSVVSSELAATVSTGGKFPGEWSSLNGEPANVLIMSAEDTAEETLQPRLDVAGADLDRITLRDFDLTDDLVLDESGIEVIERQMAEIRPKLVIIDPIVSFMGDKIDMHRSNEVRPMMVKLSALARDYDAAILVIAHVNKNEGAKAGNRVGGTVDFRNAVRSLLLVGSVDNEPERGYAIFHDKHNYSKEGLPLGYETVGAGEYDEIAKVNWIDTDLTKGEVFGGTKSGPSQEQIVGKITAAFLRTVPSRCAPSNTVKSVIEAAIPKVNERAIRRGRERVGVLVHRDSSGKTEWELPMGVGEVD
jgi:hypothetical protein